LGRRLKAIPYMMRDKSVPKIKKALIIGGIIFLFLPFHFIPAIVFPSRVGDLILWIWIIWHLKDELDKYWVGEKRQDFSKSFKGKTIIDDVEFEVKDDKEKGQ
jgi:uncharacterized membrane protein YkvA (DUF1232 family)